MAYLTISNLNKSFQNKQVLFGVDFTLEKGKTLCVIGNSGSGKTTLLRILTFLEKKDNGIITLDGQILNGDKALSGEDVVKGRKNFGLVFQSYNLFPQYTVWENILLPVKLSLRRETKREARSLPFRQRRKARQERYREELIRREASLEAILSKMNLSSKKDAYPDSLSGGEAQRTAIVRALALNPKILCFDEPTSALDPRLRNEVIQTILDLKKAGTTMIVVTHEMEFAQKIADEVVFMENGNIIEKGGSSILSEPRTEALKNFLTMGEENDGEKDKRTEKGRIE